MAATSKIGIQAITAAKIRTGGSDTTALELRDLIYEILDSYANVIDGGNVYQAAVGYNYLPTVLGASNFINRDYADIRYAGSLIDLATVLGNGNNTNEIGIISPTGISNLTIADAASYLTFNDGFTNSQYYVDALGLALTSDVKITHSAPQHKFTNVSENAVVNIVSPVSFYLPSLAFYGDENSFLGSIEADSTGTIFIKSGLGTSPISITGTYTTFAYETSDSLAYFDSNKRLHSATIGAGLDLTSGTLSTKIRETSVASSATPTPNSNTTDEYILTALAAAAAFVTPTGTPYQGQSLLVRIKDNGTARALSFDSGYRFSTDQPAPTTTIINKTIYLGFVYNLTDSKWDCLGWITNI